MGCTGRWFAAWCLSRPLPQQMTMAGDERTRAAAFSHPNSRQSAVVFSLPTLDLSTLTAAFHNPKLPLELLTGQTHSTIDDAGRRHYCSYPARPSRRPTSASDDELRPRLHAPVSSNTRRLPRTAEAEAPWRKIQVRAPCLLLIFLVLLAMGDSETTIISCYWRAAPMGDEIEERGANAYDSHRHC